MDLDELYYSAVDLLTELIRTPSVSRDESAAADVMARFLNENGACVNRWGNNVWSIADDYDQMKPTLLLNSHIDTVKPVEGWIRHPFSAEVDENQRFS